MAQMFVELGIGPQAKTLRPVAPPHVLQVSRKAVNLRMLARDANIYACDHYAYPNTSWAIFQKKTRSPTWFNGRNGL
jgi:hypothetical protein